MDLVSSCREKLLHFRIRELKDVLGQLGVAKHGKKQELVERILDLIEEKGPKLYSWGKKNSLGKEGLARIIEDTYRKMQVHGATEVSLSHCGPDYNYIKPKEEIEDSSQSEPKVRCLCGNPSRKESMIQCEDPQCQVWQHISCVVPIEGAAPEVPPHFYCELCRLKRADPFWVTTGHPLLLIKFTSSGVASDGTNTVQSIEKTFQLSRVDREALQRADYDLQVWCMLLDDKVQFRMHWPQYTDLQINGVQVRAYQRPGQQLLGINGRDDGPLITSFSREGLNKICLTRCDNRTFCFGIRIGKRRTVEQVLTLVPNEADGEHFGDALARVRRCIGGGNAKDDTDSDSDLEVITESVTVNLRCPMSGSRIRIAGRFKPCVHLGCFDLETFVEMNQRSRKWQCPICLRNYSLENIIIDPYFNRITSLLKFCGEDVAEIDLKPDGMWRVKSCSDTRDLSLWHLPDGSLSISKQEVKPELDRVKQMKQEPNPESHMGLKLGIKRNSNGIWEVSKPEAKKPSISGMKPLSSHVSNSGNFMHMSDSPAGSCRDDDPSANEPPGLPVESWNSGHEFNSHSLNYGQACCSEDGQPLQFKDSNVIILSDSEDGDPAVARLSSVFDTGGVNSNTFTFSTGQPTFQERYSNERDLGTGGSSGVPLFGHTGEDFEIGPWSLDACSQPVPAYQFFTTEVEVPHAVNNSHSSLVIPPCSGYPLDCTGGTVETPASQSVSNYACADMNSHLVDDDLAFGGDDHPLQTFLPCEPSAVSMQFGLNDRVGLSNGADADDWISLTLAAGDHENPRHVLNLQPDAPTGPHLDLLDAASRPLNMNGATATRTDMNAQRLENLFPNPQQPRPARSRLCFSIDTDSD